MKLSARTKQIAILLFILASQVNIGYASTFMDTESLGKNSSSRIDDVLQAAFDRTNHQLDNKAYTPQHAEIAIEYYISLQWGMHNPEIPFADADERYLDACLELLAMYGKFYFQHTVSHQEQLQKLREYGETLQEDSQLRDNPATIILPLIDRVHNRLLTIPSDERKEYNENNNIQGVESTSEFDSLSESDKLFIYHYVLKRMEEELDFTQNVTDEFSSNIGFNEKEILSIIQSLPKNNLSKEFSSFLEELLVILENSKNDFVVNDKGVVVYDGFANLEKKYPFLTEIFLDRHEGLSAIMKYIGQGNMLMFLDIQMMKDYSEDPSPSNSQRLSIEFLERILPILKNYNHYFFRRVSSIA